MAAEAKKQAILEAALDLLMSKGGAALTMRGVAEQAGISLGNLQYHFATREILVFALLTRFLEQQEQALTHTSVEKTGVLQKDLRSLLLLAVSDPDKNSGTSLFIEIWALARQNHDIGQTVDAFYWRLAAFYRHILSDLAGPSCPAERIDRAVCVLLPLIEGYCVTATALHTPSKQIAETWASAIASILSDS